MIVYSRCGVVWPTRRRAKSHVGLHPSHIASTICLAIFFTFSSPARCIDSDEAKPEAVPNRPTVSTSASLSAPGWFEGEFGGLYARDRHPDADPIRRASFPYSLKLAFSEEWGARIDGGALVRQTANDGTRNSGFGDTSFVLKRRFAIDTSSAFGLEGIVTAPTAKQGLGTGSGKTEYSVNAIYSADLGDWHTDVNLLSTRVGAIGQGEGRWQTQGALALSRRLDDRWGVAGEVSGTHQRGANATAQVLGAFTYAIRRSEVVDFGVARGLNRATPTWQAFAGITVVLGRAW